VLETETLNLRALKDNQWTMRCIPTLGFVVAVNSNDKMPSSDFAHQFEAKRVLPNDNEGGNDEDDNETAKVVRYFKNPRAKQLDVLMGDIAGELFDHEQRVLQSIEVRVMQLESAMLLAAHRFVLLLFFFPSDNLQKRRRNSDAILLGDFFCQKTVAPNSTPF